MLRFPFLCVWCCILEHYGGPGLLLTTFTMDSSDIPIYIQYIKPIKRIVRRRHCHVNIRFYDLSSNKVILGISANGNNVWSILFALCRRGDVLAEFSQHFATPTCLTTHALAAQNKMAVRHVNTVMEILSSLEYGQWSEYCCPCKRGRRALECSLTSAFPTEPGSVSLLDPVALSANTKFNSRPWLDSG